ncbi:Poly(beta-D-mannuronate) C5 epimerase 1 [Tritonibacter multivorans]|uniref:Poly(Beta-D-mannuronate) C5 epimerase 1 n=1 Tax=Tritonibacter multivorans TaxID=928856 RepID=A0A0P1GJA1_9RHOB|nr:fasciclin domain-containing protein [Tritonibacter multivorans]MDA7421676.1 fasciclin domain-containing protein [Tritonibacter multivorans]CUH81955.1 Poly(beta-D-mannuronate) C5 epimerase 1 [Tritonibacter multivorans]SFC91847.1 Uncaracterized surface protein containing fasciclin (FAS1) repeats [Tritonibacter multivorans]
MTTFSFTAYENSDLFGHGRIMEHAQFTVPDGPTVDVSLTDDDHFLSGDAWCNEFGDDKSGQTGTLTRVADGGSVGINGRIYAENVWTVTGDNGQSYLLVEVEQPGLLPDSFTFLGDVPPAGTELTVGHRANVTGKGLSYDQLGAGAVADPDPNIVDIAAGSDDFNILVLALQTAGLDGVVRDADDITVFAPTDAAFTQLAVDLGFDGDITDEGAIFGFIADALAGLATDGDPIPLLQNILSYHVSPGSKTAAEVDALDQVATLLEGASFGSEGTELVDNDPDIDNPNIVIPDIAASNGTLQVIDRVLLPIDVPGTPPADPAPAEPTLAGIVAASGGVFDEDATDFDILLNAVQAAGLAEALDDPEASLTVFAPTDGAFVGLSQALGFEGDDEEGAFAFLVEALALLNDGDAIGLLQSVLLYHVAPGALDSTAVLGATSIPTLLTGASLGVDGARLVDAEPDVANPNLIATDIPASNGIAHVLDGVLLPADLLQSDGSNEVDFIIGDDTAEYIRTGHDNDFVDGNGGADKILLGRGNDVGFGGDGADYMQGGRGNDTLRGDDGDDKLRGGSGDDLIDGGLGDDNLMGNSGFDTFVFNTGDGHDTIRGFQQGEDLIDLSAMGISDFDLLLENAIVRGSGVQINISEDQSILVRGPHLDLMETDFILALDPAADSLL